MAETPGSGGSGGSPDAPAAYLRAAQALVDEALACAESGAWEQVADLDARCQRAIAEMMTVLGQTDPGPLADGLGQLRDAHHRLRCLAEAERDRLVDARRQSSLGRSGTRAYEDNA